MPLDRAALSTLSRLLDEAMDLPTEDLEARLAGLGAEHGGLVPKLREMLSERTVSYAHGRLVVHRRGGNQS